MSPECTHNAAVRDRTACRYCGDEVPERDHDWKYAQAGGVLAGPFCDSECQFGWLLDD